MIHPDFEKGYIRAQTIAYEEYIRLGGEAGARDAGKLRAEAPLATTIYDPERDRPVTPLAAATAN